MTRMPSMVSTAVLYRSFRTRTVNSSTIQKRKTMRYSSTCTSDVTNKNYKMYMCELNNSSRHRSNDSCCRWKQEETWCRVCQQDFKYPSRLQRHMQTQKHQTQQALEEMSSTNQVSWLFQAGKISIIMIFGGKRAESLTLFLPFTLQTH